MQKISRRNMLKKSAVAGFAASIVPAHVLGGPNRIAPSDKVNVAIIGAGGQGIHNLKQLLYLKDVNVVAICDVVQEADYSQFYYGGKGGRGPGAKLVNDRSSILDTKPAQCKTYIDFRKMLDQEKSIDAVLIATPDHNHYITAMEAISRGKHVYCEKPLAHSVYETRKITEAANKAGIATQLGNHGHSGEGIRLTVEWLRDGAIGNVTEIHSWSNNLSQACMRHSSIPTEQHPIPKGMDWELWQGPVEHRSYHPSYSPFRWRDWWAYGTSLLGDMGCHNMDPAFWGLNLGSPESVQARNVGGTKDLVPFGTMVEYSFPKRGTLPPVKMTWYSGLVPPRPDELEDGRTFGGGDNGILFVGDKGKIMCPGWGGSPRIIPESKMREYDRPKKTIKRVAGHHRDWIDACKGGDPASSNFNYSGPLTEMVLLGVVAMQREKKLYYDAETMRITNDDYANSIIKPEYHNGWMLG